MSRGVEEGTVLLTGATGFVGNELYPLLVREGYEVRCASRSPLKAQERWPEREWVQMDLDDPWSIRRAMRGCRGAFYLIHRMTDEDDFVEKEAAGAMTFLNAAEAEGVERMVYLGGVKPQTEASRHLQSRLVTGAILRGGSVSTVELRASMVIGSGSASWQLLRDLAVRLPVMLVPVWLRHRTQPVAIDDVTTALLGALRLPLEGSAWWDIPGPETLTFEECLRRTAHLVGHDPVMIHIPILTPRLSSYWLKFVTRANFHLSQELVEGLRSELLAEDDAFWHLIDHTELIDFDTAARIALKELPGARSRTERIIQRFYRDQPAEGE